MKLSIRVRGDWFAVPCDGSETIAWLGEEALKRYNRIKPQGSHVDKEEMVYEIRKTRGGAILDRDDTIVSVLDENDYVSVVLESDQSHPSLATAEIPYIPEQVPAEAKLMGAKDFIYLDGNSLTCDDLMRLGKGELKIKLSLQAEERVLQAKQLVDGILTENNGVGQPLTPERTRRLLALRINILAKGYSGISLKVLQQYVDGFNASCLPWIPEKGTVGASGDLAPMAHLALGMMGEGKMWSPRSGWGDARYVLESHGLTPIKLGPKEGLALINGTQLITSLGVEDIHKVRPHPGQGLVARRFRSVLHSHTFPSEVSESHRFCNRVQDAYTLRCCPQVHGIVNDTISFVRGVLTTELNSAQDNPLPYESLHGAIQFDPIRIDMQQHDEPYAASGHMEALSSVYVLFHFCLSENKVLCHPASIETLSTSAGTEDHVSMGGFSARKALIVIEHVEQVIAIELLAACQALEFLRPLKTTAPLEEVHKLVRGVVASWDKDRFMAPDIDAATTLLQQEKIWDKVKPYMDEYHNKQYLETPVHSPTASYISSAPIALQSETSKRKRKRVDD
ncbi:hypothetical protein LSH36_30g07024 [Paralvinella palmiformis]|uniref:Par3/HAL N-terminal domain-containing protein n=1 Tax=Paralvinella palmiformis TaxID=53620 RepID=A0AAD9K9X7_9ANNE|nr:hypothetical protein LSH36_30g07024 [Paralvinella palmiformis]